MYSFSILNRHEFSIILVHNIFLVGYDEESTNVLSRAADFHRAAALQGLLKISQDSPLGRVILQPPKKGQVGSGIMCVCPVCIYVCMYGCMCVSVRICIFVCVSKCLRVQAHCGHEAQRTVLYCTIPYYAMLYCFVL